MIPRPESLLKYDHPVSVSRTKDGKSPKTRALKMSPQLPPLTEPVPPPLKPRPLSSDSNTQQDVLDSLFPPREWAEANQLWVQRVATTPSTRSEVVQLQERLDSLLQQRQARETGICPVRLELYEQCFDELIRQVTISCAERGVMLLRVRNEVRMTRAAYQTLYESSMVFGARKALQAQKGQMETKARISQMAQEKKELQEQLAEQRARFEALERTEAERRQTQERKHNEEMQFLNRNNQQQKELLEMRFAPKN